jgi:hypothetical protein
MTDFRISGSSTSPRSETDIRLNYGDPSKVIAASNDISNSTQAQFYSVDGGSTWNQTNLPSVSGDLFQSDPMVDWTSDGTAWAATLGVESDLTTIRVRTFTSSDNGATWTVEANPSGSDTATDREIMWVDHSPTSPYKDQIYLTWHSGVPVFFVRRTAGPSGTWQTSLQLSGAETTGLGIGGDVKTNSFGDVFVFWQNADGNQNILFTKSTDGGATFGAPIIIATTFATNRKLSVPADSGRKARVYISAGAYRTATKNLVYAVWSDLSGASGCTSGGGPGTNVSSTCKTRVWFSRSSNGGVNWSAPVMLNNQSSLNDQFHSRLCVDESNGNLIVTYRDTVSDSARLQTDVWMQSSTDDGQTWSSPVKVTSARSDVTSGADSNQYGDYDGLHGFHGTFFPAWTDRRSGGTEEIWSSRITLIQKNCHFIVEKSTFGQDEVQAMLTSGSGTFNAAFYVVMEGFLASDLGIVSADLSGAPTHKPTFASAPMITGMTIGQPTALLAEDPSLPAVPQRFTWVYPVSFTDATGFTQPITTVTLSASMASVSGNAQIQLIQQPNPYELDGEITWLSTDLRVFQINEGQSKFGASVGGSAPTDATSFIKDVITNLNSGTTGGSTFESDLDPKATEVSLYQTDKNEKAVFNFAIAKVRYRSIAQDAQAVRVFFRLCPALTVSLAYDQTNTYRTYSDGVQYGHKIPRLGKQNNNILTIPCFATERVTPSANMDTQIDIPNAQTIPYNTTGAEITRYFGCWLDINQPGQLHFPLNPTNEGPYSGGSLKSILELIRNQHQCLLAEIAFDPVSIGTGATPGTSDKLAQRNLSLVASANPGDIGSRRIPNTFELKPSSQNLSQKPDELMISWGDIPSGSVARIYLPGISADEIVELAAKGYSAAKLTPVDNHTIECSVDQITYIPIPPGPSLNHTGLLTIDLPEGIKKGQNFNLVVHQVTQSLRGFDAAPKQEAVLDAEAAAVDAVSKPRWRRIRGSFQIVIPVQTKDVMLEDEERLFSILKWILESIPGDDRWYDVFRRYVEEMGNRVRGLGGKPESIPPSPTGHWKVSKPSGPAPKGEITFSGKVCGLVYDRFGDFEGFLLDTDDGEWRFHCREHEIEDLVSCAWSERIAITVFTRRNEPHLPKSIILRRAPRPFQA